MVITIISSPNRFLSLPVLSDVTFLMFVSF